MGKYYTPSSAIRFANSGSAALKRMTQTVEPMRHVSSDNCIGSDKYSGVIRYDINSWKHNTSVYLFPPSISDVFPDTVLPSTPTLVTLSGSNFAPNSRIFLEDVEMTGAMQYVNQNTYLFQPPASTGQFGNIETGVTVKIMRPDLRTGTLEDYFFYEYSPIITSVVSSISGNIVYNDGYTALAINGNYIKQGSTVVFIDWSDPTSFVSGTNLTWVSPNQVWLFTPAMPATSPYGIPKIGVFKVKIVSPSGLESNSDVTVESTNRTPQVLSVSPNQSLVYQSGTELVTLSCNYLLPGVVVQVSSSVSGVQPASTPAQSFSRTSINAYNLSNQPSSTISFRVVNTDAKTSNWVDYNYILPTPVITSVSFVDMSIIPTPVLVNTGSAPANLYIYGTAFSGSTSSISLQNVYARQSGTSTLVRLTIDPATLQTGSVTVLFTRDTDTALVNNSNYDIIVENSTGSYTYPRAVFYRDAPSINSFETQTNTSSFSTNVVINGGTFYSGSSIAYFGGVTGTNVSVTDTQLTVTPPPGNGTWRQVNVYVVNYGTLQSNTVTNGYLYSEPPVINSISPTSGSESGAYVYATMSNYVADNYTSGLATKFSTSSLSNIAIVDPMTLTVARVSMSSHIPGFVYLTASNGVYNGAFGVFPMCSGTATQAFEFVANPTIAGVSSSFAGTPPYAYGTSGTLVQLTGSNFASGSSSVYVNDVLTISSWTSSGSMSFYTPSFATNSTYDVKINSRGVTSATRTGSLKYVTAPFVSGTNTRYVSNVGAVGLQLIGTNFSSPEANVILSGSSSIGGYFFAGNLNAITASISTVTPTMITFSTPVASSSNVYGAVQVFVKNIINGLLLNQASSSVNEFRYEVPPVITDFNPKYVATGLGSQRVDITGSGFVNGPSTIYTTLLLGGFGAVNLQYADATHVYFDAPNTPNTGLSSITLYNGSLASPTLTSSLEFRNVTGPNIQSISPNNGIITTNATTIVVSVSGGTGV